MGQAYTGWQARYGDAEISQFIGAEMMAEKWEISRDAMEAYSLTSHQRAVRAAAEGRFGREIVPLAGVSADEGPRADTTRQKMAALPTLTEGGRLTAAVCSQISDGAAALLIASDQAIKAHRLTPRARIHHVSARGADRSGSSPHRSRPPSTRWPGPACRSTTWTWWRSTRPLPAWCWPG